MEGAHEVGEVAEADVIGDIGDRAVVIGKPSRGVAPGCGAYFGEFRQMADSIRDAVIAADEAARQADVYPGTRRDILRRAKLDYAGWTK